MNKQLILNVLFLGLVLSATLKQTPKKCPQGTNYCLGFSCDKHQDCNSESYTCSSNKICLQKVNTVCTQHSECISDVCMYKRCVAGSCPADTRPRCLGYICKSSADCYNGSLECNNGRCLRKDGITCDIDSVCSSSFCKESKCAPRLCPVESRPRCINHFCKNDGECFNASLECAPNGRCLKKVGIACATRSECGTNWCPRFKCEVDLCPGHKQPGCLDQQCLQDAHCFNPQLGCFARKCKRKSNITCSNDSECGSGKCNVRCA